MLFGYSLRTYVETQNSDVNVATMDAAFVAVCYGWDVCQSWPKNFMLFFGS